MRRTVIFFFVLFIGIIQPAIADRLDRGQYSVVINHEEQYTIWLKDDRLPKGWKSTGFVGNKDKALRYIEKIGAEKDSKIDRREDALRIYKELKQKR